MRRLQAMGHIMPDRAQKDQYSRPFHGTMVPLLAMSDSLEVLLPNNSIAQVKWVKSARSRSLRLSLTAQGLRMSSPLRASRALVEKFLSQQAHWIQSHLTLRPHLQPNTFLYHGREYTIQVHSLLGEPRNRIHTEGTIFHLTPVSYSPESAKLLLERWLRTEATDLCTPLIQEYSKKMGVEVPTLRFREAHTRWGSCAHDGAIMLNWRLIHTPPDVAKYVVIHELAHRVHLNHSDKFWQLVEKFDPDFRVHRGWLKRHGHLCHTPEILLGTQ